MAKDWYQLKKYDLGEARTNYKITDFPEDGDCILVLENENQALNETSIKFESPTAHAFDIEKHRKLRHRFKALYLTNVAASDKTLKLLIGKGVWDVERHYPEEKVYTLNADTVDSLHASASIEAGKLLALGSDGFFPDNAVRNLQSEIYANIPSSPVEGDMFIATDTIKVYACYVAGAWTEVGLTSTFDANTILAANVDNTPLALTIAEQRLVGRITAGNITALTAAQVRTLINVENGAAADQTSAEIAALLTAANQSLDLGSGNLATTGTIDGVDVSALKTDVDGFPDELKNLVTAEIQQVENIGPTTISAAQWAWLGGYGINAKARAYLSSNQLNIVNVTETKVNLDTETYDPGSNFDDVTNYRFTAPVSGYYQVNASVTYTQVVTDKSYLAIVKQDGTTNISQSRIHSAYAAECAGFVSDVIYLASSAYIELYAKHDAGVNTVDVVGSSEKTFMSVHFLSKA